MFSKGTLNEGFNMFQWGYPPWDLLEIGISNQQRSWRFGVPMGSSDGRGVQAQAEVMMISPEELLVPLLRKDRRWDDYGVLRSTGKRLQF
jgi:hypothetical protein